MMSKVKTFGQKEAYEALKTIEAYEVLRTPPPRPQKSYLEHRKSSPRARQLKSVQLIFNDGHSTYNAILKDISEEGARIQTEHVIDIPDVFTLKFTQTNEMRKCSLIWRDNICIGVRFIPT